MNARLLVLDTMLLVLFVVGTASRAYIAKHKRLTAFTEEDYVLPCAEVSQADAVFVTPNTLTETSNWLAYIAEPARSRVFQVLRQIVETTEERYLPAASAVRRPEFIRLGLTDATLLEAVSSEATLLTTDLDLQLAATAAGASSVNFNHLRDGYM